MYKQEQNSSKRAKNTTPSFFRKINVKKGVLLLPLTVKAEKFFKQISLLHLITTHAWKTIKRLKIYFLLDSWARKLFLNNKQKFYLKVFVDVRYEKKLLRRVFLVLPCCLLASWLHFIKVKSINLLQRLVSTMIWIAIIVCWTADIFRDWNFRVCVCTMRLEVAICDWFVVVLVHEASMVIFI